MVGDLTRLLSPSSIAVIGGGAWCENVIRAAQAFGFEGEIWPVHPHRQQLAGLAAVASVQDLPTPPDAAFVGVNHAVTVDVIADLAEAGAGGAVAFASGFGEVESADAANRQARLVKAAGQMPVLGPNCYGFVNGLDRAALWPDQHGLVGVDKGVAILTQSSNIAINLTMQSRGLPIGMIITAGNQAQLGLADLGQALISDPRITALGLHIEGVGDVRAFEQMAQAARKAGKPVVVLKAGRSEAAQVATLSHTASLAGSSAGASALFQRLGFAEASGLGAFLETLKLCHVMGPLPGTALASMSCSGGEASLIADMADRLGGLEWAALSKGQTAALARALGPKVTLANPLDYHTYIWNDPPAMAKAYAAMMDGKQALTLLVADFPRADRADPKDWDCIVTAAIEARRQTGGRLAMISSIPETMPEKVVQTLAENGIAALNGFEDGLRAIKLAADPVMRGSLQADPVVLAPEPRGVALLDEAAGKAWLTQAGVGVPKGRVARYDALRAHVAELTLPVVLKGQGIAHKTEAGAVVLGLQTAKAVVEAAQMMGADSYLVEEQIEGAVVEMLVGVVRDPAHGFVLTIGAGGTLTEIWKDTVSMLIPTARAVVSEKLDELTIAPILRGYRGRPAVAREALLDVMMQIQEAVTQQADQIAEVEINPLIVTDTRAVAVDALIRKGAKA